MKALFWAADCQLLKVSPCDEMEGDRELRGASFIRALIPIMRAPPSWSHHLLEAPPLNIIILRMRENTSFCLYGSY